MSTFFLVLAIISVAWGLVSSIGIVSFLMARGHKINFIFIRLLIIKYVHDYQVITTREDGHPGPWFYSYITAMNLALIFAVIGMLLR